MSDRAARHTTTFEVDRKRWDQTRFVEQAQAPLDAGQVLFRIDRFAFTSNNVTYCAAGDMLDYWGFFPAEAGRGRIPAMGFADVEASSHPEVAVGERVFGFFPMATHLCIDAARVGAGGFEDGVGHRAKHAPAYRQYARTVADPLYDAAHEDATLLLRGLFTTSFLVDDFLDDNGFFGAERFVISSASSKTAIALAHQLSLRDGAHVVGLTSPRNAEFVRGLGLYDEVIHYADLESISAASPVVYVDHSGDGDVNARLHGHFGDALKHSAIVGATHWEAPPRTQALAGPEPTFFFAPAQIVKRSQEWGPAGYQQRLAEGWRRFRDASSAWLTVVRHHGREGVEQAYHEVLSGKARPDQGHVLSLHPQSAR